MKVDPSLDGDIDLTIRDSTFTGNQMEIEGNEVRYWCFLYPSFLVQVCLMLFCRIHCL
jgi:hypothetical protein